MNVKFFVSVNAIRSIKGGNDKKKSYEVMLQLHV